MQPKPIHQHYLWIVMVVLLVACNSQTPAPLLEPPIPTLRILSPSSVPTSTFRPVTVAPSPLPTEPAFPVITADPIQAARWNEYEDALAKAVFNFSYRPEDVVCEWVILEQVEQEVYVWAYCASIYAAGPSQGSVPAVIHLGPGGSVQSAEIPGSGTAYGPDIQRMFPPDSQDRIFNHRISSPGLDDRIRWRRGHPDEPPLIILHSLSTQPTPAMIPWGTPDSAQLERWREYETALARELEYLIPPEEVVCEWEFLGRIGNEAYVWAICGAIRSHRVGLEGLVRIDVVDGSVRNTLELVGVTDIRGMLPPEAQEKYFHGEIHFQELVDHLQWRQSHPEELPLIVLRTTPTP